MTGIPELRVPITVGRLLSLLGDEGRMFSPRCAQAELERMLGHMAPHKVLIAFAGADEYVDASVNKNELVARLLAAMGEGGSRKEGRVVAGADHSFHGCEDELLAIVLDFLQR